MEALTETLMEDLATYDFLRDLEPTYLSYIADCAENVSLMAGETILQEKQPADTFYLIRQGKLALGTFVPGRGFITIQILEEGDLVGWSWLVPPYEWRFEVLTITPAQAIAINGVRLREQCEQNRDFGYEILKRVTCIIGERLKATRVHL